MNGTNGFSLGHNNCKMETFFHLALFSLKTNTDQISLCFNQTDFFFWLFGWHLCTCAAKHT